MMIWAHVSAAGAQAGHVPLPVLQKHCDSTAELCPTLVD